MSGVSPRLTFVSRAYCHLCDDMLVADGEELCHYLFDEPKVREYLARFR